MRAWPMCRKSYTVMPHTYMRIWPGVIGCSSCFSHVSELCMRIMCPAISARGKTCESFAPLPWRHRLQQRRELRAMLAARERHAQRHVELGAFLPGRSAHGARDCRQVVAAFSGGVGRRGKVLRAGGAHQLLFRGL